MEKQAGKDLDQPRRERECFQSPDPAVHYRPRAEGQTRRYTTVHHKERLSNGPGWTKDKETQSDSGATVALKKIEEIGSTMEKLLLTDINQCPSKLSRDEHLRQKAKYKYAATLPKGNAAQ